ncbi:MAG: VCBS repeat-containing protein, partial [Planctomycetota bacterium]
MRQAADGARFRSLAVENTGLDFAYNWKPGADYRFEIYNSLPGGGICVGDYNGDDLPDVFLTQPNVGSRLYRNLGGMKFADVTAESQVGDTTTSQGATFVDVDNDGDLDL